MTRNAFTIPTRSFAQELKSKDSGGGKAAARKARGVAVPSLSNQRGAKELRRPQP